VSGKPLMMITPAKHRGSVVPTVRVTWPKGVQIRVGFNMALMRALGPCTHMGLSWDADTSELTFIPCDGFCEGEPAFTLPGKGVRRRSLLLTKTRFPFLRGGVGTYTPRVTAGSAFTIRVGTEKKGEDKKLADSGVPIGTFRWYQSTRNHFVARFGKRGSVEAVRPQRHDPRTRQPRPWRARVFGSYCADSYGCLDDAKRAAEREAVREVVRLMVHFGLNTSSTKKTGAKS
jgi:hypothetical protein